jgi:hypothetical protein
VGVEVTHVIDPSSAATVQNPLRRSTLQAADDQALPGGRRRWHSSSPRARSSPSQRVGSADPVSGRGTAGSRRSTASAWRRVESCQAPYRCRTRVRSSGVVMNAAAPAAQRRSGPVRARPNASRATIARQVNNQRSRYAGRVVVADDAAAEDEQCPRTSLLRPHFRRRSRRRLHSRCATRITCCRAHALRALS